jgi:hypothetical protein
MGRRRPGHVHARLQQQPRPSLFIDPATLRSEYQSLRSFWPLQIPSVFRTTQPPVTTRSRAYTTGHMAGFLRDIRMGDDVLLLRRAGTRREGLLRIRQRPGVAVRREREGRRVEELCHHKGRCRHLHRWRGDRWEVRQPMWGERRRGQGRVPRPAAGRRRGGRKGAPLSDDRRWVIVCVTQHRKAWAQQIHEGG